MVSVTGVTGNYILQNKIELPSEINFKKNSPMAELNGLFWMADEKNIFTFNPQSETFSLISVSFLDPYRINQKSSPIYFFKNESNEVCFFSETGLFKLNKK